MALTTVIVNVKPDDSITYVDLSVRNEYRRPDGNGNVTFQLQTGKRHRLWIHATGPGGANCEIDAQVNGTSLDGFPTKRMIDQGASGSDWFQEMQL
jgi:hypothetical protein